MHADAIREALERRDFGERLVAYRLARGMQQKDLARASNLSQAHLSQLENDRLLPSVGGVRNICYMLDVSTEEMLQGPLPTRSSNKPKAVA